MKIVRNETTKELAGIGAVAFEAEGREYWGTILRTFDRNGKPGARTFFDVELRTRFSGSTHSRALPETAKAAATRSPDNGIYQIKAHVWSGPRLYSVSEYESDEAEAARMDEYFRANP